MPPPGLAASVVILPLVDEPTRQALLRPELVRLPDCEVPGGWGRPRFMACTPQDELETKQLLYSSGVATAIKLGDVWCWYEEAFYNGFVGVVKAESKHVAEDDPVLTGRLRGIWKNLNAPEVADTLLVQNFNTQEVARCSSSGTSQDESVIGRAWPTGGSDTVDKPTADAKFASNQLAKDFNITKICLESFCRKRLGVWLRADVPDSCRVRVRLCA